MSGNHIFFLQKKKPNQHLSRYLTRLQKQTIFYDKKKSPSGFFLSNKFSKGSNGSKGLTAHLFVLYLDTILLLNMDNQLKGIDRVKPQTFIAKKRFIITYLFGIKIFHAQSRDNKLLKLCN